MAHRTPGATAENIAWLQESGRRYIVVSREQHRRDVDLDNAQTLQTASNQQVFMDRVLDESGEELRLYCYSAVRAAKETAIEDRKAKAFEAQLTALVAGIENDSVAADIESVCHRIGQIKKTHSQA